MASRIARPIAIVMLGILGVVLQGCSSSKEFECDGGCKVTLECDGDKAKMSFAGCKVTASTENKVDDCDLGKVKKDEVCTGASLR